MTAQATLSVRQKLTYAVHLFKALTKRHQLGLRPLLRRYIAPDAVVFDIGANAGNFTHIFSQMAPQGHVYAFEPGSYALSILRPVIALRCRDNVTLLEHGLSDQTENLDLHLPVKKSGSVGHGLAHIGHDASVDARATISESITLKRIDDIAPSLNLTRLDFIKIDVEGWELHALKGGAQTIARFQPAIMLEMSDRFLKRAGNSKDELLSFLRTLGYQDFSYLEESDGTQKPLGDASADGNVLCLPTRVLA